MRKALSFDDVMLVPRLSDLNSRAEVDLSTRVAGRELGIPIIAANMTSVCEDEMAVAMERLGGLGIIHRFCSIEQQAAMLERAAADIAGADPPLGFAIGIDEDWARRLAACVQAGGRIACLDVAHAHHQRVTALLAQYFDLTECPLIIGQVSTVSAVADLLRRIPQRSWPKVAFKVSIGGGSLCTTRIKTGFGIPTLQAVMDITRAFPAVCLIADGGIRDAGDIVKALAAGADAVMLGRLLAGTEEAPGNITETGFKAYRGSASFSDKLRREEEPHHIEGEDMLVPLQGPVKRVVNNLLDGVRSGFSYGGAHNLSELQDAIEFVEITSQGYRESLPHGK